MGHQMELCIMWNFKETERQNVGTGVGGDDGLGRMGTTGSTPKHFNDFACNLHNRAYFCKTIKSRGSNPMF